MIPFLLAATPPVTLPAEPAKRYPYASIQLGVAFPKTYSGEFSLDGVGDIPTELDLNTGFNGELALGYTFNRFRSDLSVGYSNFGVNEQRYSSSTYGRARVAGQGSMDLTTLMLNGYYDVPIRKSDQSRSRWSPYIGAGIGYANISTPACAAADCYEGGSDGSFAWQAKAGVSYRASERGFAFLEGGYIGTAGRTSVDEVGFGSFGTWRLNLGWRQGFGGAPKGTVVVTEHPAPQASPDIAPVVEPVARPQPSSPQQTIRGLW